MDNDTPQGHGDKSYSIAEIELLLERKLREHEDRERAHVVKLVETLSSEAFPDGATAHRAAHVAMIDAANAERDFWKNLKLEIAKKSIWGILQILLFLAAAGLLLKLGLSPAMATLIAPK